MTLPVSRNTNYSPGATPVRAADMNDLQDNIINRKFPPTWWWRIPLGRAASEVNLTWDAVNGFVKANPGPANFDLVPAYANVGDRITTIGARVLGTGAGGNVVVRLYRNNGDGTARTQLAALTITTPPASWGIYTVALGTPEVVADQKAYFFQCDIPTTNQSVAIVGYQSDRL
jgi:hypothetical protein